MLPVDILQRIVLMGTLITRFEICKKSVPTDTLKAVSRSMLFAITAPL